MFVLQLLLEYIDDYFSLLLRLQDVMQQATNAILRGGTIMTPSVSAKTIAEQLAEKINAKLNYTPVEKLEEERQAAEQAETVKRYEEELEINDFPQVRRTLGTSLLTYSIVFCLHFLIILDRPPCEEPLHSNNLKP